MIYLGNPPPYCMSDYVLNQDDIRFFATESFALQFSGAYPHFPFLNFQFMRSPVSVKCRKMSFVFVFSIIDVIR